MKSRKMKAGTLLGVGPRSLALYPGIRDDLDRVPLAVLDVEVAHHVRDVGDLRGLQALPFQVALRLL